MKITFDCSSSADSCATAADLASRCGFDGIELNPEDAATQKTFANAKVEISAINIGSKFKQILPVIAIARELGCRFVRVSADSFFARRETVLPKMIDRLLGTGDIAAENGVSILVENQPTPGSALGLWHLLDRLNHPSIACCWNTLSAARAGDAPAVAVPMLNTRIRYVHLQDAKVNNGLISPCAFGTGDLPLRNTANRLRGIGYTGFMLAGTAQSPAIEPAELEQTLAAARAVLQQWQVVPIAVVS